MIYVIDDVIILLLIDKHSATITFAISFQIVLNEVGIVLHCLSEKVVFEIMGDQMFEISFRILAVINYRLPKITKVPVVLVS